MKTPTSHKPQLSHSRTSSFCHSNDICKSRLWHSLFIPLQSGLYFVFRAPTFWNPVGAVSSPSVSRRAVLKEESCFVFSTCLHCAPQTLRGFAVTEDIHLSQVMSPSTNSMTQKNLLMRNGQSTPIPQGGRVSGRTMSSSLPALPVVLSDQFF